MSAAVEYEFKLADVNWGCIYPVVQVSQNEKNLLTQIEQTLSSVILEWRKRVIFQVELQPGDLNRLGCRLICSPTRPLPI